jgi:hypothetical protein
MIPPENFAYPTMLLNQLGKMTLTSTLKHRAAMVAAILCLGIATSGCVSSTEPILGDSRGLLGDRGQLHLFDVEEGGARNPRLYQLQWSGGRYAARGRPVEVSDFTIHAYEGRDLIVQARAQRPLRPYFYALARKLTDGVYLLTAIDANDADEATRNRFCIKTRDAPCRIETPEQLFVFAKATAAKESDRGKLAVLVRGAKR